MTFAGGRPSRRPGLRRCRRSLRPALLLLSGLLAASGAEAGPAFDPLAFFAGSTRASGVLTDASGQVTSRYTGTTVGHRDPDGATTFDQTIRFDDGSVRERRWRVVRTGRDTIQATGTDVVGVAQGRLDGSTLHLVSEIQAEPGNLLTTVHFDQVMTLAPGGRRLANHSVVSKLGFVLRRADEVFVRTR